MKRNGIHVDFGSARFESRRIMTVTHNLADHPMLQLPSLLELARRQTAAGRVRKHSDKAAANTNFIAAPDLLPMEASAADIHREHREGGRDPAGSWHQDGARLRPARPRRRLRAGPRAVPPPQHARPRRLQDELQRRANSFEFRPGVGAYMPSTSPHWVKNHDNVSITMSFTYYTRSTSRIERLDVGNYLMRRLGVPARPVGQSPLIDRVKNQLYKLAVRLVDRRGKYRRGHEA
jgi:hypothetical protein